MTIPYLDKSVRAKPDRFRGVLTWVDQTPGIDAAGFPAHTRRVMPVKSKRAADRAIFRKNGIARSPEWDEVERAFRAAHPRCAACDETAAVNVHHQFPFHYVVGCGRPDLELDPRNLVTLCTKPACQHHLLLGHLDDWESYSPAVNRFIKRYAGQAGAGIRAAAAWKKAAAARPKHLDLMTDAEKAAFKAMLDKKFTPLPAMMAKAVKARIGMDCAIPPAPPQRSSGLG